jgi:hypothetical protein
VIAEPLLPGAVHETDALPSPAAAVTPVGAVGTPAGVTAVDAALELLVVTLLVAITANVYGVPLVRPLTVQLSAPGVEQVRPPGDAVATYWVMALPLFVAAAQPTSAAPSPAVAVTEVGADGAPAGVTEALAALAVLVPIALVAVTVKV